MEGVALHPEGVDRNHVPLDCVPALPVALHPEGVDRNKNRVSKSNGPVVALHPEGVDRNLDIIAENMYRYSSRPPPGGRG